MEKNFVSTGNKLIAEFMLKGNSEIYIPLYNEDWNWLMAVVERIEEMDVVASFQIESPEIYIWASTEDSTFEDIEVNTTTIGKLNGVYEACIKFIKWYNNENR